MMATHNGTTQPMRRWLSAGALLATGVMLLGSADPGSTRAQKAEEPAEAATEARVAIEGFHRVMEARAIPAGVLRRAAAVGVFPGVVRAAFLIGGQGGGGVVTRRTDHGWTAPAFFKLSGGSIGAQIGGTKTDLVLLFMTKGSVDALLKDRLEVGSEVVAVAGPDEARAADASGSMREDILVYSRHQGLFAGVAVDGALLTPRNRLNEATYALTAKQILSGTSPARIPPGLTGLADVLAPYSSTSN